MLIRLQAEQIAVFWDSIKLAIVNANGVPEGIAQDYAIKALQDLLIGDSQCWMMYEQDGDEKKIYAIGTTRIINQSYLGTKMLELSVLYGFAYMTDELVKDGLDTLVSYAKANNCVSVEARTDNKRVMKFLSDNQFDKAQIIYRRYL